MLSASRLALVQYLYSATAGPAFMPSTCRPAAHPLPPPPLTEDHPTKFEFENGIVGNAIPPTYIPACEKGFREAVNAGALIGHPVEVRCPW